MRSVVMERSKSHGDIDGRRAWYMVAKGEVPDQTQGSKDECALRVTH